VVGKFREIDLIERVLNNTVFESIFINFLDRIVINGDCFKAAVGK